MNSTQPAQLDSDRPSCPDSAKRSPPLSGCAPARSYNRHPEKSSQIHTLRQPGSPCNRELSLFALIEKKKVPMVPESLPAQKYASRSIPTFLKPLRSLTVKRSGHIYQKWTVPQIHVIEPIYRISSDSKLRDRKCDSCLPERNLKSY